MTTEKTPTSTGGDTGEREELSEILERIPDVGEITPLRATVSFYEGCGIGLAERLEKLVGKTGKSRRDDWEEYIESYDEKDQPELEKIYTELISALGPTSYSSKFFPMKRVSINDFSSKGEFWLSPEDKRFFNSMSGALSEIYIDGAGGMGERLAAAKKMQEEREQLKMQLERVAGGEDLGMPEIAGVSPEDALRWLDEKIATVESQLKHWDDVRKEREYDTLTPRALDMITAGRWNEFSNRELAQLVGNIVGNLGLTEKAWDYSFTLGGWSDGYLRALVEFARESFALGELEGMREKLKKGSSPEDLYRETLQEMLEMAKRNDFQTDLDPYAAVRGPETRRGKGVERSFEVGAAYTHLKNELLWLEEMAGATSPR